MSEQGEQVRQARLREGLSRYRLAIKAGVHPNTVLLAERGACSRDMLDRVARALGLASSPPEGQP